MTRHLRHALRLFARQPLFTLTAVASLAIGIGANATIFTAANALLLAPTAGIHEPHQIVDIGLYQLSLGDTIGIGTPNQTAEIVQEVSKLLQAKGGELAHPVDGNEVFVRLPAETAARLKAACVGFYPWLDGSFRFVCSWATTADDVAALGKVLG